MQAQRLSKSLDNLLFDHLYTMKYIRAEELVITDITVVTGWEK